MLEFNRIYNMDCLEGKGMKLIEDKSIDMILCDLPYGTTACKWDTIIPFEPLWEQYKRIIKDNGAICLFGNEPFSSKLRLSALKMYKHEWYWDKEIAANFVQAKNHPLKIIENIIVFSKSKINYNPIMIERTDKQTKILKAKNKKSEKSKIQNVKDKYFIMASGKFEIQKDEKLAYPKNIIVINKFSNECNSKHRLHPTQKPVELFEYLIKTYTNEGDLILDNCIGSGTTAIAALNTGRFFIGFELSKEYCDIANKRIEENKTQIKTII